MKCTFTLYLLASQLFTFSQDITIPIKDAVVHYEVIDSTTGTKDVLYGKAKAWLAKSAKSSKDVIQLDDIANGKLIGKGLFMIKSGSGLSAASWPCNFVFTIDAREDKCRLQLSNFTYGDGLHSLSKVNDEYTKGKHKKAYGSLLESMNKEALALLSSFAADMKKKDDF